MICKEAAKHTFIKGNFNAKGEMEKQETTEENMKQFIFDERYERGGKLLEFITARLYSMASVFYETKQRKCS